MIKSANSLHWTQLDRVKLLFIARGLCYGWREFKPDGIKELFDEISLKTRTICTSMDKNITRVGKGRYPPVIPTDNN